MRYTTSRRSVLAAAATSPLLVGRVDGTRLPNSRRLAGSSPDGLEPPLLNESPERRWETIEAWNNNTYVRSLLSTDDGIASFAGRTGASPWYRLLDADGETIEERTLALSSSTLLSAAVQTEDGGYALGGNLQGGDVFLAKLDDSAVVEWETVLAFDEPYGVWDVAVLPDGEFALCGWGNREDREESTMRVTWFDADGEERWSRRYQDRDTNSARAIVPGDDGVVVAGSSGPSGWLLAVDDDGEQRWDWSPTGLYNLSDVVRTGDGGYVIVGSGSDVEDGEVTEFRLALWKLDGDGRIEWDAGYPYEDPLHSLSIVETDRGYLVAGEVQVMDVGESDNRGCVFEFGHDGVLLWKSIEKLDDSGGFGTAVHHDDVLVVGGSTQDCSDQRSCGWLIAYEVPTVPPIPDFDVDPEAPTVDEPVTFDADPSYVVSNSDANFDWFVDGEQVSDESTFAYRFDEPGPHEVGLSVTVDGATETAEAVVEVEESSEDGTNATDDGTIETDDGTGDRTADHADGLTDPIPIVAGVATVAIAVAARLRGRGKNE